MEENAAMLNELCQRAAKRHITLYSRFLNLAQQREGEIAARPLCDGEKSGPCEHCDYADICRRSVSRAPDNARLMQRLRFDELLEKLNQTRAGNSDINQV